MCGVACILFLKFFRRAITVFKGNNFQVASRLIQEKIMLLKIYEKQKLSTYVNYERIFMIMPIKFYSYFLLDLQRLLLYFVEPKSHIKMFITVARSTTCK